MMSAAIAAATAAPGASAPSIPSASSPRPTKTGHTDSDARGFPDPADALLPSNSTPPPLRVSERIAPSWLRLDDPLTLHIPQPVGDLHCNAVPSVPAVGYGRKES